MASEASNPITIAEGFTAPTQESLTVGDSMDGIESMTSIEQSLTVDLTAESVPATETATSGSGEAPITTGDSGSGEAPTTTTTTGDSVGTVVPKENSTGSELAIPKKANYIDLLMSPVVIIQVGDNALSAHLALLIKSPWFAEACAAFTPATPAAERVVALPDDDIDAVGSFLEYLYTNEYFPRLVPGASGKAEDLVLEDSHDTDLDEQGDHLLKHAKVYTLAEKLRMPELKHLAHSKIHRINSTAKGELRYAKFVYENTTPEDKTIRNPIASFWAHRSHVLRHDAEDDFKNMVLEFPQFALDILTIVLDQKEKGKDKERKQITFGGGSVDGEEAPISATKTPRTGRKRPRTGL